MPTTNPLLEDLRQQNLLLFNKERESRREEARHLLLECDQVQLPWAELPYGVQERVCRSLDTTDESRGYAVLAALLSVHPTDAAFYQRQSRELQGPTALLLQDQQERWRGLQRLLPARLPLQVLLQAGLLRCLTDVRCAIQEAVARRRQMVLLRESSDGADSQNSVRSIESGYQGSLEADKTAVEFVGAVEGPPDATLVQAVPVRSEAPSSPSTPPPPHKSAPSTTSDSEEKRTSGATKVLLTYAADGRDTALAVADELKQRQFRVLLLEEQRRLLQREPYTAVQKCFKQVHYVVPLLTAQYLAATQNRAEADTEQARRLAADARFVYTLMCDEMVQNDHVNWRVRSLVPDDAGEDVRQHPIFGSPLFRWPYMVSELDEFAECLSLE